MEAEEPLNTLDIDKLIQLRVCVYNACLIAAMVVTLLESIGKLTKLFELISQVITLDSAIYCLQDKSEFFNRVIPCMEFPAEISMQAANIGNKFLLEPLFTKDWIRKVDRYI